MKLTLNKNLLAKNGARRVKQRGDRVKVRKEKSSKKADGRVQMETE